MRNDHQPGSPLSGVKILDVGCGGGLLTEVGLTPFDNKFSYP